LVCFDRLLLQPIQPFVLSVEAFVKSLVPVWLDDEADQPKNEPDKRRDGSKDKDRSVEAQGMG
jgi:hypothetical protein